jgi:hypothetical protein
MGTETTMMQEQVTAAGTQRARRASAVPAAGGEAGRVGALAPGQRWSAARKREVVMRLLRGESMQALSRELAVETHRLQRWFDQAMAGIDEGLRERGDDPVVAQRDAALKRIGELSMEVELLRERSRAAEARLPLGLRKSRA